MGTDTVKSDQANQSDLPPVIAIDGPSGTGKGTLAKRLANRLGWHWLESGALYRLVAYIALSRDLALDDIPALAEIAANMDIQFKLTGIDVPSEIRLEGVNVDAQLREEAVGNAASHLAKYPLVREALLNRQHSMRQAPGLVADGRDMGSVVFPDAKLKLFLEASIEIRGMRRYEQLIAKGISANLDAVQIEMAERDARDRQRVVSPLKPAQDAVVIDTSDMPVTQVFDRVTNLLRETGIGVS